MLALRGTVVTMDDELPLAQQVMADGCVYVDDGGFIAAVQRADVAPPLAFTGVPPIDTGGAIWPGLIDLHSHVGYNTLPLWAATGTPYKDHDQWTRDHTYGSSVSWPSRALAAGAPQALLTYVQVKALVGGTTSIQGAPKSTRPVDGWLMRMIDVETFGTSSDRVRVSALQQQRGSLQALAPKLEQQRLVLIYHVGEGTNADKLREEFDLLQETGCATRHLIGVHATALTGADFARWPGGTVVWSPFSNLWLYHGTTDVVTASRQGIRICLGSDWAPSGTKHVLGELKVADIVNRDALGGHFSDVELCAMVTRNPGDAFAAADPAFALGRIVVGAKADLSVFARRGDDPYRGLIEAREGDVRLVVVDGQPRYGLEGLMRTCGVRGASRITVGGRRRSVVTRLPGASDASLTWPQTLDKIKKVRADPTAALQAGLDALMAFGGAIDEADAPLVLIGDMPEGDAGLLAGTTEIPADITVPAPDTLVHDAAFFAACASSGAPHLAKLKAYYQ